MIVEVRLPKEVLHRLDVLTAVLEKDRSQILVDAVRNYLSIATANDEFLNQIADAYNEDVISDEELRLLIDADDATFQALKQHLDGDDVDDIPGQ